MTLLKECWAESKCLPSGLADWAFWHELHLLWYVHCHHIKSTMARDCEANISLWWTSLDTAIVKYILMTSITHASMYFDVGEMCGLHDSSMFYFIVSYLMHIGIAMNCGLFNMFTLGKSAHQVDSYGSLHAKQTHMEVCMPNRLIWKSA